MGGDASLAARVFEINMGIDRQEAGTNEADGAAVPGTDGRSPARDAQAPVAGCDFPVDQAPSARTR